MHLLAANVQVIVLLAFSAVPFDRLYTVCINMPYQWNSTRKFFDEIFFLVYSCIGCKRGWSGCKGCIEMDEPWNEYSAFLSRDSVLNFLNSYVGFSVLWIICIRSPQRQCIRASLALCSFHAILCEIQLSIEITLETLFVFLLLYARCWWHVLQQSDLCRQVVLACYIATQCPRSLSPRRSL